MKATTLIVIGTIWASNVMAQQSSANPDFNRPLFFDVKDNELKVRNPKLIYSLQKHNGKKLEIGNLTFTNESFVAKVEGKTLNFKWDTSLVPGGDISVFNEQGKELWRHQSEPKDGQWSYSDLDSSEAPQWKSKDRVRFCIRSDIDKGYSSMCTQWYAVEINGGTVRLGLTKSSANPRVIYHNEEKKLEGQEDVAEGTPIQFLGIIDTGATYEFMSEPAPLAVKDMIESDKSGMVTLTAGYPQPLKMESSVIDRSDEGSFSRSIGFQKTIAIKENLWQADIPGAGTRLFLPGKSGGVFAFDLEITNAPKKKDRRYIAKDTLEGTYLANDELVYSDDTGKLETWKFAAPEKFKTNKAVLELPGEKSNHKSYFEVYRGGSGEASLRLTALTNPENGFLAWGETHVSWWFNDIFGSQNSYLSKQRWGVSAKYFTSLSDMKISDNNGETTSASLQVMTADLRYRFTPGLWERDETTGLIISYESMNISTFSVPKLGAGLFWARSMPKVFDDLFNMFPLMEYPKWVDMEYIQYSSSMDSKITLGLDYELNFHGKVLWKPNFFGEAGFGAKGYNFENTESGDTVKLIFFYATVGLGFNF